jgi:hypothetical protein
MSTERAGDEEDDLTRNPARNYEKPFGWWGLERDEPEPRSLPWLVKSGTLSAGEAAFLTLAVELRRTLIVVAEESQAGKTTLLTALLAFMHPATRPIYVRGIYERFAFVSELEPDGRYVLCNEISAHLPTYLWGRGVRHLFDGLANGFRMATTMHAASAADALNQLQRYPLDVPASSLAWLDLIVTLKRGLVDTHEVRRVVAIDRVVNRNGRAALQQLSVRDPLRAAPQVFTGRMIAALAEWGGADDAATSDLLAQRERFLSTCIEHEVLSPDQLKAELAAHRAG